MAVITVVTGSKICKVSCVHGQFLSEALHEAKVSLESPCGGEGVCGKCRVSVEKQKCPPPSAMEEKFFSQEQIKAGFRLACTYVVQGDVEVRLTATESGYAGLNEGYLIPFTYDIRTQKKYYQILPPKEETLSYTEWLFANVSDIPVNEVRNTLYFLGNIVPRKGPGVCDFTVVKTGNRLSTIEEGKTTESIYGVAVDIGTTTIVAGLVDMLTGKELGSSSLINPQKVHGADVLSRISYVMEERNRGLTKLQRLLVDAIESLIKELCENHRVSVDHVYEMCVAANTSMLHFLLGVSPVGMGRAPFLPVFTQRISGKNELVSFDSFPQLYVTLLPSLSAYIGADVVAGAFACGMDTSQETSLFLDIGTNGEMILAKNGSLFSCSCAAGPSFEGMNVYAGMKAADGAVEDLLITWKEGEPFSITREVIGGGEANGLCGSGVLSAIRELRKIGLIQESGYLLRAEDLPFDDTRKSLCITWNQKAAINLGSDEKPLLLTQHDIRQIQLAKGAILASMELLFEEARVTAKDLKMVYVAGQFGAHLPVSSLFACGILAKTISPDNVRYVHNTAKSGAYMGLMSESAVMKMEKFAKRIMHKELTKVPAYERLLSKCMRFPEVESD